MSKHKVKRYDGEDESMVEADAMEMANKGENLDTEAGPKAMPRRPISRTPVASKPVAKASTASTDDRSKRPSLRGTTDTESRDRFGIPTSMGNAGKNYAPTGKAAESASGSELMRNLEAAGNATGASAAIQGVRRGAAVGKGLAEFAAGRKAAPAAAKAAPAVNAKRTAPKADTLDKFNAGLKKAKSAADREKARMDILKADTLKTGGKVKGYASGGSTGSFRSSANGIAQRGKTRGKMC